MLFKMVMLHVVNHFFPLVAPGRGWCS